MLAKLKLGWRLGIGFALVLLITGISSVYSLISTTSINNNINTLYSHPFAVKSAALEANANIIAVHRAMKDVALAQNNDQLEAAVKEANTYNEQVLKNFQVIQEQFLGDKKIVEDAINSYKDWTPIREETIRLKKAGEDKLSGENTKIKGAPQVSLINKNMAAVIDFAKNKADTLYNSTQVEINRVHEIVMILGIFSILFGIFIAIFITLSVTRPVSQLGMLINQAANGDLTIKSNVNSKAKDEISKLAKIFNTMIDSLNNLVTLTSDNAIILATSSQQLMAGSETTSAASQEISASVQQVSIGAEKQTIELKEIVNTLAEFSRGSEETAINMQDISNEVLEVNELSEKGKKDLELVISQIGIISETSNESVTKVKSLEEKSKAIEEIINVITSISGQTNLLALNAAIEAARAGEAGKGFAVVSDEIRKLAEQSSKSTTDISVIVKEIQSEIINVIQSIEAEKESINDGINKVDKANQSFADIIKGFDGITNKIQNVSAVAEQMSAGTEQAVNSIRRVGDISSENAVATEEVAASVEEQTSTMEEITASATSLAEISSNLLSNVSKFKIK